MHKGEFEFCDSRMDQPCESGMGRRDFLYQFGAGLGSVALTDLLYREHAAQASVSGVPDFRSDSNKVHHPARA
ncbi:MAG: hypothetical protein MK103_03915, partial [Planctomycetes bacterium]|nr:hypothetical protein [Planctomycetota bacterium]